MNDDHFQAEEEPQVKAKNEREMEAKKRETLKLVVVIFLGQLK